MTTAAGFSNVTAIDGRPWIARREDRGHVAVSGMTINTRRGLVAPLNSLCVKTAIVGCVRVRMKLGAAKVRQGFTWCMATLALKIGRCGFRRGRTG